MTARALDHGFPVMTPDIARDGRPPLRLSVRPPHTIGADEQRLALEEERDRRRALYPHWIEARRITADEADRHQRLLLRILEDLAEPHADIAGAARIRWHADAIVRRQASPFRWSDKVRELRREIQLRRNAYPRAIATDRMDEADARLRLERLEAVHWRYWIALDHWDEADPAELPHAGIRARAAAVDAWLADAHRTGHPALAGYLSPAMIAWLDLHHPHREAA